MKKLFKTSLVALIFLQPLAAEAAKLAGFVDALTWHASEQTASIWSSEIKVDSLNKLVFAPKNINFDWHEGFRAGLLYEPENQFWDTKIYWTHYSTQASTGVNLALQVVLPEFFSGFLSGDKFFIADVDWQYAMHTLDLQASHAYPLTKNITLRPVLGIKAGSIKQHIDSDWVALTYTSTEKVDHNYYGAGPSIGMNATWDFYQGFNLFGTINTAYMYGRWNTDDTYHRPAASGNETTITTKMSNAQLGTLTVESQVGLEWINHQAPQIGIKLAYEMQYWANQLRLSTFQELPLHGDLTLQGVTCGIYIEV